MKNRMDWYPNVLPKGAVEPINNVDLIVAQLKHESEINKKSANRIFIGYNR